jgi:GDPmannose 4,6-dehydratase
VKKAFITGITGQDGSYLAELLVEKGYQVAGLIRPASINTTDRIQPLIKKGAIKLFPGDLLDAKSIRAALLAFCPDELYNLAAMSHVKSSFSLAEYVMQVNGTGVIRLLEAIKEMNPNARIYQASTSELFGKVAKSPQNEETPFHPRSPYGIAKLQAFWAVVNYREAYGMYACNGILFNHESPRRGEKFVSRKISLGASLISAGKQEKLFLGNLNAKRDWGYAKEFVHGMWQMLQQEKPQDFVLATGKTHTVREFVQKAFAEVGKTIVWEGLGVEEKGIDAATGRVVVEVNPELFRPAEVDILLGDASKAKKELGWEAKTSFEELVALMVKSDQGSLI